MDKKKLRIIYMGTPDFAVAPLSALINGGYNIVGVVTSVDKPAGRGRKLMQSAVKQYLGRVNSLKTDSEQIALLQPEKLREQSWLDQLAAFNADLFIVVAFRMLPEMVWKMPRLGTFNLHASLLPLYRGAAPINWAIINGETYSGVTTFFLNEHIDKGEIIDQHKVEITAQETAGSLHDKLMNVGSETVLRTVDMIAQNTVQRVAQPQIDDSIRTVAPKIFKDDCKIDWSDCAEKIYNKIRGLSPYPAAWCELNGIFVKIIAAHFEKSKNIPLAGSVDSDLKHYYRISCADGWVYIDLLHPSSKRVMTIEDFLRGHSKN